MKVILRTDVENLGHLGEIVEVRPGYGRNYLIPQGIAMLASNANLKNFESERKKLQAKMDDIRAQANALAQKLDNYEIVIPMRVGENEKLYGAVTSHMIADILNESGFEIDRRRILLDSPIRVLGEHPVRIRLHPDVIPTVNVKVVAEERGEQVQQAQPEQETQEPQENESNDN